MKILQADFILTCNDNFDVLKDGAVVFDGYIKEYGNFEDIKSKYPNLAIEKAPKNSVLMPGLINPHVHLEFSSNKSTLAYGDFITWLNSVISKRDDLISSCSKSVIKEQLELMLRSGTTTLGAISSFNNDLQECKNAQQRVVFFTELLGSRPDSVDILFSDFKSKLAHVENLEDERLIPAISIHSPYSTHPILAKNALDMARKRGYAVSTHFMESPAEREWLDDSEGDFISFFNNFAPNAKPMANAKEYIELFKDTNALFTHCVQASKEEIKMIKEMGGYVTHCPVSNRLLGVGELDLEKLTCKENFTLGTDGLSSNISLNMWNELRAFLFMHTKIEINALAKLALLGVTNHAANALKINTGSIEKDKYADFIICTLPDTPNSKEDVALNLILHVNKAEEVYISGEKT